MPMTLAAPPNGAPSLLPPTGVVAPPLAPYPPGTGDTPLDPSTPPAWQGPAGPQGPQGAVGPGGATGPQGVTGNTGATGSAGPQGTQGVQGPPGGAPAWKGEWSAATTYVSNDAVSYVGSSYYAPSSVTLGVAPPAAPWQQIAAKGDTGPQGVQGIQGTTGATGSQGIQGIQGPQGTIGNTGPAGPGVPTGGTTGQILNKTSATDFATAWVNVIVTQAMYDAVISRLNALEARPVINSIDDLVYGPA